MFGELLAFHDKLTVWVDAVVPVPVRVAVVVGSWALLVKVNVAVAIPAVIGLNVTAKEALASDAIVIGRETPLTVNTELFVLTAVTVTLPPCAVSVPDAVPLVPSTTLPTAIEVGVTVN